MFLRLAVLLLFAVLYALLLIWHEGWWIGSVFPYPLSTCRVVVESRMSEVISQSVQAQGFLSNPGKHLLCLCLLISRALSGVTTFCHEVPRLRIVGESMRG